MTAILLYGFQVSYKRYCTRFSYANQTFQKVKPEFATEAEYYDSIVNRIIETNSDDCSKFVIDEYTDYDGSVVKQIPRIAWSVTKSVHDDEGSENVLHVGCSVGTARYGLPQSKGAALVSNRVKDICDAHNLALDQVKKCHPVFENASRCLFLLLNVEDIVKPLRENEETKEAKKVEGSCNSCNHSHSHIH